MIKMFRCLMAVALAGTLFACQDIPAFPDPGFDFISDKTVEVRRDTADSYEIVMRMNVPNGVDRIELLNGMNYELIESFAEYKGKDRFEFKYRVDFSNINVDTTLNFIIKVIDLDARSFNRGMTIKVKRFSIPEILVNSGDHVGISSPTYLVRAKITTGMNTIDSIKVLFEGKVQKTIVPDHLIKDTIINELVVLGTMEWDKEYHLDIVAKDNKGQETTKRLTVLRKELQKPKSLSYYEAGIFWGTIYFQYDDKGRLKSYVWDYTRIKQVYTYTYTYNEQGLVSSVAWQYYYPTGLYTNYYKDRYYYKPNSTQLDYATSQNEKLYDTGAFVSNSETKFIENVVYNSNGTISSVVSGATLIDNLSYDPGFTPNDWIFAEYWYTPYSAIRMQYRQKRIDFQPVFMPTYVEGLPPFSSESGYTKELFCNLFISKYIYGKNQRLQDPSYDKCSSYSYVTDSEGRITNIIRTYYNVYQWLNTEYRLNY